jgi:DNA-binding XRE family transcriptional regulator
VRKAKESGSAGEPVIYNRLKVLRAERSLSRQALAEELGINYQTVGYIERGDYNPSLELAFRVCEFFGLPVEAVFSREPFRPLSEEIYGASATAGDTRAVDTATSKRGR